MSRATITRVYRLALPKDTKAADVYAMGERVVVEIGGVVAIGGGVLCMTPDEADSLVNAIVNAQIDARFNTNRAGAS